LGQLVCWQSSSPPLPPPLSGKSKEEVVLDANAKAARPYLGRCMPWRCCSVLTREEFRHWVPSAQRSTALIGFGRNACELKGQNEWAEAGALYREALRIDRTNPTPPLRHDGILLLWRDVMRHAARCRAAVRHVCHMPLRHDSFCRFGPVP
jgi:hypothetical protein